MKPPRGSTTRAQDEVVPVCIVGGGPVGMTLAIDLASRGIRCTLVERNAQTTRHPKMDITNARTMELFRRVGLVPALRAAAVPENHPFDVSWVTSMAGHELHRFPYPSVDAMRKRIRETNDGSQPLEPPMRVSQVEIEPVLKRAIDAHPLVTVRFGVAFEELRETSNAVVATVREAETGRTEEVACSYLVGCDGGTSRVRSALDIALIGKSRVMERFMTHFRSDAREVLQRWGVAWHYQSPKGTLIAQNDRDIWTLHSRFPHGRSPSDVSPSALLEAFAGTSFPHAVLVANAWSPHLVVAESYGRGRVLLAGDAVHQYIPTGGYGMNTGIGDAFDLGWKLAATIIGFGSPELLESYEAERRPVGIRNCEASRAHNQRRIEISALYGNDLDGVNSDQWRRDAAAAIAAIGNLENEQTGVEYGYRYAHSPITLDDGSGTTTECTDYYQPNSAPGARLPSVFLNDGSALYDRLAQWFTLISFDDDVPEGIVRAAQRRQVPLQGIVVSEPSLRAIYRSRHLLVRPDHHIAWRSAPGAAVYDDDEVIARVVGSSRSSPTRT
jgi:2-polyprenyl-6-methoxyphenol hydroxylase-like FAD-dependent oxidoreductase